jgi:large subunit ribosomal protein L30
MSKKKLRIKYVKSCIGYTQRQKATIRALGLKRLGDEVVAEDNAAIRGMIDKVSHLLQVQEV